MATPASAVSGERSWLPAEARARERAILEGVAGSSPDALAGRLESLIEQNRTIHELDCINLNPATNVMNPRAEAALSASLGSRPSLGYAGAKYEMGLEAIEQIEVIAADLARRVFGADYAEIRVGSGALANLSEAAHTLRGSAGNVGAFRLAVLLGRIEAAGKTGDAGAAKACLALLDAEYESTRVALLAAAKSAR